MTIRKQKAGGRISGVTINVIITFLIGTVWLSGCTRKIETRYDSGQLKEKYAVKKDAEGNYIKDGAYVSWYEGGQKKQGLRREIGAY